MPLDRPIMIYDGDCGFCRAWIARWQATTGARVTYRPFQEVAADFPELPLENLRHAVHLVTPEGEVFRGAEAVFRALAEVPGKGWMLAAYRRLPGARPVAEALYRAVADHRNFFSRLTTLLWGRSVEPESFLLARWIFLRALGLVYFAAFASLAVQIQGLVGSHGILPAAPLLRAVAGQHGAERFHLLPSVFWMGASDAALSAACIAGCVLALLLIAGVAQAVALPLLWIGYLSLVGVGRDFLSFQWDALLLEAGFLALLLAPWSPRPGLARREPPSGFVIWLFRWLLFRLMFGSGVVKLLSGDPSWRSLTALRYHFETQPLPTPMAWYGHHLPAPALDAACAAMFVIELAVPFLVFTPRRPRILGAALLAALQILILITGNYAFFNLLTLALCVLLLDDRTLEGAWRRVARARLPADAPPAAPPTAPAALPALRRRLVLVAGTLILCATLAEWSAGFLGWERVPPPLRELGEWCSPLRIANSYGLFAVMTTTRPEIILEGSRDGETWQPYEFRWKPGDPHRAPPWVAPHQPRLDWQMWFAALGGYRRTHWFEAFESRVLEGSPTVLALFAKNPFPDAPPRYLRAILYDYQFTSAAERRQGFGWWKRKELGAYAPEARLKAAASDPG